MRRASMLTASLTAAAMLGLMTPGAVGATATTPSRQASCATAWDVVAREGVGLAHDDAAAWNRVSEAFISLSDESFDGPVSNALGDVFTASADVGAALASATGGAASHADFDAALGALGTVCAHLTVTQHKQDVALGRGCGVPEFNQGCVYVEVVIGEDVVQTIGNFRADGVILPRAGRGPCLLAQ